MVISRARWVKECKRQALAKVEAHDLRGAVEAIREISIHVEVDAEVHEAFISAGKKAAASGEAGRVRAWIEGFA